ncbi:MAG: hypothetical protein M1823_002999 [Watsoniomyces obsoletus]|nr:MAG: hypothetical protein M1823_002999 [Watsoniomyces obsoletus]
MVKSYLKYEHARSFGVIASASANVVWTPEPALPRNTKSTGGGRALVAANEEVLCWDVKKGELLSRWKDSSCRFPVTAIAQSKADLDVFAVGYEDGTIRLWDAKIDSVILRFNGHRSAVTTLAFDQLGVRLASGAKDTDIIVWDLVAEVGEFKLRGHKDQVTALNWLRTEKHIDDDGDDGDRNGHVARDSQEKYLITTGKDSLIKIWDLETQHCIETHVTQTNGECWAMAISPDQSCLFTVGNDGEMKFWELDKKELSSRAISNTTTPDQRLLHERGTLLRYGKDRALGIHFHPKQTYFAVHGSEKAVEIWRIRTTEEVQKTLARRRKRKREKKISKDGGGAMDVDEDDDIRAEVGDLIGLHVVTRTTGRVRSVDWAGTRTKDLQLLVATTNNQLEFYSINAYNSKVKANDEVEYNRLYAVELPGHRTDIRSLSLSSNDTMLASASNGALKIWNVQSGACIRTFECGYALCCSFLPGDRIVVVGTKAGAIEIYDIGSAAEPYTVTNHLGPIWTLQVHPNGKSMVSGSADKTAQFWDFTTKQQPVLGTDRSTRQLSLLHTRTLSVADDILSVRYSPDGRLIALALLDNTVKVFFANTAKLYLTLYGHKLPVLSMDISYDSKLIVTSSADKNIRIWGLDFGDCHKALFAHQDSIMQVGFIPHNGNGNGHHFFSCSKDRLVKYWDGDKFEQIQKLDGHHGEIWALAVGHTGECIVTASHDQSIRVWEETDMQLFLEEEREKELEELYESTLTASLEQDHRDREGDQEQEVGAAGKQTTETLVTGERIMEALELGMLDLEALRTWKIQASSNPSMAPPARHPIFIARGNISAEEHVLAEFQKVPAASLHDALLILPFSMLSPLLTFLDIFAQKGRNIPLTCRILFFVLGVHHRQIVAAKLLRPLLERLCGNLRKALQKQKDEVGFNLAALRMVGERVRQSGLGKLRIEDVLDGEGEGKEEGLIKGRKATKRAFVDVA